MMKHFIVSEAGAPLQLVDTELPEPQPDEVQIRILATGIAFADVLMRHGVYPAQRPFPLIPGYDIVGTIEKVGQQVMSLYPRQKIAEIPAVGGFAEMINLPASEVIPIANDVDAADAVSIGVNYLTAYQILHRTLQVKGSERLLVHSAAGGVGTALLQLGKLAGLEMYGTASKGKHDLIKSLGAIPIDYQHEDFVERIHALTSTGVDIVLDPIGGDHLQQSYRALNDHGRLVAFGTLSLFKDGKPQGSTTIDYKGSIDQFNQLDDGRLALGYSFNATKVTHPDWTRTDLTILLDLLASNKIRPIIDRCLPLSEAPHALELLETGKVAGKLVLLCDQ